MRTGSKRNHLFLAVTFILVLVAATFTSILLFSQEVHAQSNERKLAMYKDAQKSAQKIEFNKEYHGVTGTDGEPIYYTFTTSKEQDLKYTICLVNEDAESNVYVNCFYKDFSNRVSYDGSAWAKPGKTGKETRDALPRDTVFYAKVESDTEKPVSYILSIKQTAERPNNYVLKTAKSHKKGQLKVKLYKVDYGKESKIKYQIKLKKNGGKWKIYNNGSKTTRTFKGLKSGAKYKIKARAMRKFNGKWYAGYWHYSETVKIK